MTCIVAIEHEGAVYMGSDRAGSDGWGIGTVAAAKTFQNGPLLIGYTTSFRMGQLLQHALVPPTQTLTWDVDRWVATDLMAAVRATYGAHGWDEVESNKAVGGNFLLAVQGRAYEIQSNYSFIRNVSGEYAVGSGEMYAKGSLHSTRGRDPMERLRMALEAAAEMSPSVAGPFDFVTQEAR